jgi:hypothetical protein
MDPTFLSRLGHLESARQNLVLNIIGLAPFLPEKDIVVSLRLGHKQKPQRMYKHKHRKSISPKAAWQLRAGRATCNRRHANGP